MNNPMNQNKQNNTKRSYRCSQCGEKDHNKRTCPHKPIEDTFIREDDTYVIEEIFSLCILIIQSVSKSTIDELGYIITAQIISHFQKIKHINMPNINESLIHGNSKLPLVEIARRL